jgi:hypothetical protein
VSNQITAESIDKLADLMIAAHTEKHWQSDVNKILDIFAGSDILDEGLVTNLKAFIGERVVTGVMRRWLSHSTGLDVEALIEEALNQAVKP